MSEEKDKDKKEASTSAAKPKRQQVNRLESPTLFQPRTSYINLDDMFDNLVQIPNVTIPPKVDELVKKIAPEFSSTLHRLVDNYQEYQQKTLMESAASRLPLPVSQVSYEGFINLAVVLLLAACVLLVVDNFVETGILVDLTLLKCLTGDLFKAIGFILGIVISCTVIFLVSQLHLLFIWRNTSSNSNLLYFVHYLGMLLYITGQALGLTFGIIWIIYQNISMIVSAVTTLMMLVYGMKLHSYYMYIIDHFYPMNKMELDDKKYNTISVGEYLYFLIAPTLCFARDYPRIKNIRILFCLRMLFGMFICAAMSYILMLQYIDPVLKKTGPQSIFKDIHDVMKISIPWFICWLLGSFALFHCYLNLAAELTGFADRLWYKDFWNATDFSEFWRKWNILVHTWLWRYAYHQYMRIHYNKPIAMFFTFFLSAILHELAMSIMFHSFKFYFFLAMVVQFPFVYFSRKFTGRLANFSIWLSLFTGQPLMLLLYFRDWYKNEGSLCR